MTPKKRIFRGMALLLFSYVSYLIPEIYQTNFVVVVLYSFFFLLGVIYVGEGVTLLTKGTSLLHEIKKTKKNLIAFIFVAAIGGLLLDGVANWLGKLWIYPRWGIEFYALIFVPGFTIYWLVLVESYLGVKAFIDKYQKGRRIITKPFRFEKKLFTTLGAVGAILLMISLALMYVDYTRSGLRLIEARDVSALTDNYQLPFLHILVVAFGLWLVLEWFAYYKKKSTLIKDTIHGYFTPLAALFINAYLLALLMEWQNIPVQLWTYTNWPINYDLPFGFPLLAFIVWPLHSLFFLSLMRALLDKESDEIWKGDVIP